MKKLSSGLLAASLFLLSLTVRAELLTRDHGLVYDADLDVTWIADLDVFGTLAHDNPNLVQEIIATTPTWACVVGANNYGSFLQPPCNGSYTVTQDDFRVAQPGALSRVTWYGAQAFAGYLNAVAYLGFSDWRIAGEFITEDGQFSNEIRHLWREEFGIDSTNSTADPIEAAKFAGTVYAGGGFWLSDHLDSIGVNGYVTGAAIYDVNIIWSSGVYNRWQVLVVRDGDVAGPQVIIHGGPVQECSGNSNGVVSVSAAFAEDDRDRVISYDWLIDGEYAHSGKDADLVAPLGRHEISLHVRTEGGRLYSAAAFVDVADTVEPQLDVYFTDAKGNKISEVSRAGLNFVTFHVGAYDVCDANPMVTAFGGVHLEDGEVIRVQASLEDIIIQSQVLSVGVNVVDQSGNTTAGDYSLWIVN